MTDQKVSVIEKLLAKAESTNSEHEAEALMAKAQEMMVRYGIEQAMIDARRASEGTATEQIITKENLLKGSRYNVQMMYLGHWLAPIFNLRTYKWGKGDRLYLAVVGFESDVAQWQRLFDSLRLQAMTFMGQWWRESGRTETGWAQTKEKRAYLMGWTQTASGRAKTMHEKVVSEAKASGTGTEVVLASRKARVDQWVDQNLSLTQARGRGQAQGGWASRAAGAADGARANVGGRGVGNGARAAVGR